MKRLICFLLTVLLVLSMGVTAIAAEFEIDLYTTVDGMGLSWYQGYTPVIQNNTMSLYLPVKAANCVGNISVSIALDDPDVFLLSGESKEVTVSPKDGIYPVKLSLPLQSKRRNGDYPATITFRGRNASGKEIIETVSYIIRIRDGYGSHETMLPVITDVVGDLNVGSDGSISFTVINPTTTQSITDGEITVLDNSGDVAMTGSNRIRVSEILPGESVTVTIPVSVRGIASVSLHKLEVKFSYRVLGTAEQWVETFTVPVTQAIRLEQGGVQLPPTIAGELSNMTLPLMNMGKGELYNVLVKLEMDGVLDAQSVLVGCMAAGETKQAKLTFTPKPEALGTYPGTVTITCEDAYGNAFSQTLDVRLTVDEPIPEEELVPEKEKESISTLTVIFIALSAALGLALILQGSILTGKLHKMEEERL